jgi:hypothetical protein
MQIVEQLGNRAADGGRSQNTSRAVDGRGTTRRKAASQDEQVALEQGDRVLAGGQVSHTSGALLFLGRLASVQHGARDEVRSAGHLDPAPAVGDVDDGEAPLGVARISELHALAQLQRGQPVGCDGQAGIRFAGGSLREI